MANNGRKHVTICMDEGKAEQLVAACKELGQIYIRWDPYIEDAADIIDITSIQQCDEG